MEYTNEQIKQAAETCTTTYKRKSCEMGGQPEFQCCDIFARRLLALESEATDLRAKLAESQKRERAAENLIAKLYKLCNVPKEWESKTFRRLIIGAGDYMGSGYAFVDAFNRLWDDFMDVTDDTFYEIVRAEIEKEYQSGLTAQEGNK